MDTRTGKPWPPSRFGNVNSISISTTGRTKLRRSRKRDKPASPPVAPSFVSAEWTTAGKALRRLGRRYPSELEIRPAYFNGKVLEQKSHLTGYGAARNAFERFLDRQTYWHWSWMLDDTNTQHEDDTESRPHLRLATPPAVSKAGRKSKMTNGNVSEKDAASGLSRSGRTRDFMIRPASRWRTGGD